MTTQSLDTKTLPAAEAALGRPIRTALDLAEAARGVRSRRVLVHPSAHAPMGLPDQLPPPGGKHRGHPFVGDHRHLVTPWALNHWLAVYPGGAGTRVDLYFPGYETDTGLSRAADGESLRLALLLYEETLGTTYRWSPGTTGAHLLRKLHPRLKLDLPGEPPEPAQAGATESDFRWVRGLTLLETQRRYVYAFDVNAAYLAACSSVELGLGEPEHLTNPTFDRKRDGATPGYWQAAFFPADPSLPDPLRSSPLVDGPFTWATTPTMVLADELKLIQGVRQAYVYPRRSRYLAPWYERIRRARESLTSNGGGGTYDDESPHPYRLALDALKATYTLTIGQLNAHFRNREDELYRPDWRHAVIARARCNLYRALVKLPPDSQPFAVATDTLYIASDAESHQEAAPGLKLSDQLGHLKPEGRVELARVRDAIEAGNFRELRSNLG